MEAGVDGLLRDKTRPPGKAPVPAEVVAEVVRLTQEPPPHEATHWTAQAMAKTVGLAVSTVQKNWKGLAPHRWRSFKLSNDRPGTPTARPCRRPATCSRRSNGTSTGPATTPAIPST